MKTFLIIVGLVVAGYFAYQKYVKGGGPLAITDPVYAEMRAGTVVQGREIEMAIFVRARNQLDCSGGAREMWAAALKDCPSCTLQAPKCSDQLAPRYAKLFDDVPIPSTYLSATSGGLDERDGRIVVYGLTDAEGAIVCETLRTQLAARYRGKTHCVKPSG